MRLQQRIGCYSVTAKIGEGGMGEVYQARDTKLDRDVALKVLPEAFTSDPDRLARFEREAKVLAALNHPNIGSIYGLEEAEGVKALVLELVEGPTLADRIKQGPIPIDEALPIAKQIAEALEAAHEQGVIHRDLKPANIKVRDDGTVKVLDFGLAKAFQPDASDPNLSASPTISLTAAATQMGMVIGTAAYMSPEQARGKVVDRRADIFAFGVVVYEMLTGRRPFQGEDVSLTLAAVMTSDPDLGLLPQTLPPTVKAYLARCLAKDPKERARDIGDVRLALAGGFDVPLPSASELLPDAAATAVSRQLWQRPLPLLIGTLVVAITAGLGVWYIRPSPSAPVSRFTIPSPGLVLLGPTGSPVVSPDGRTVVFISNQDGTRRLYQRALNQFDAVPIQGTEGATDPVFSPDGQWVAFWTIPPERRLKKVPLDGGPATTLSPVDSFAGDWGPDEFIVFGTTDGLWACPQQAASRSRSLNRDPGNVTPILISRSTAARCCSP